MNNEQIIIDVNNCLYHDNGECRNSEIGQCNCTNVASCYYKECKRSEQEYKFWLHQAKLGSETTDRLAKELEEKEQECEELKKELHKNFKEKDTLHLIIDRLLEASGYDTNTASAEDFEDVYEHMRYEQQQLDQLKAENDKYSLFIEKLCDYAGLECDNEEQAMRTLSDLASQMNKARWIIDRYKQTLADIKEIACDGYNNGQTSYATFQCEKILGIINEIEQ